MQISLYLLCFLQFGEIENANKLILLCFLRFGELKGANKLIFTVLFAIWRGKKCK